MSFLTFHFSHLIFFKYLWLWLVLNTAEGCAFFNFNFLIWSSCWSHRVIWRWKKEKGLCDCEETLMVTASKKIFFTQFSHFVYILVAVVVIEIGMSGQGRVVMGRACLVTGITRCMNRWRRWTDKWGKFSASSTSLTCHQVWTQLSIQVHSAYPCLLSFTFFVQLHHKLVITLTRARLLNNIMRKVK